MAGLLEEVGSQASEEEQKQLEKAVEYLERLITAPAAYEQYAKTIAEAQSVPNGIATVGAQILIRLEKKLELSDDVKMELIDYIIPEVIELASEMQLIDESQVTDKLIKSIVARGTEEYALLKEQMGEGIDPAKYQSDLAQMEADGSLAEGMNAMSNDEAAKLKQMLGMMKGG